MSFIFVMACREIFWDSRVTIEHSLSDGLYCEVHIDRKLKEADVENIKNKMKEIVNNDYVIEKLKLQEMKLFLSLKIMKCMKRQSF